MIWEIAILEDGEKSIEWIQRIISQYFMKLNMDYKLFCFQNTQLFFKKLPELSSCRLFLLGTDLPDCQGIQAARRIREVYAESYLIFITDHMEYASEAFEVGAFRYININLLEEKLELALDALMKNDYCVRERAYCIQNQSVCENIAYRNIYYLFKMGKYVMIIHNFGVSKIRKSLHKVYEELNSEQFIFIDKSFIVNVNHVIKINDKQVIMSNQDILPVSIPRIASVKQSIIKYWSENA